MIKSNQNYILVATCGVFFNIFLFFTLHGGLPICRLPHGEREGIVFYLTLRNHRICIQCKHFPKMREVKGRLVLFWKFICFGNNRLPLIEKSTKGEKEEMMSFWKELRGREEWEEEEEVVEVRELNKEKVEMKEQMNWERSCEGDELREEWCCRGCIVLEWSLSNLSSITRWGRPPASWRWSSRTQSWRRGRRTS